MINKKAVKGMNDILPSQAVVRRDVQNKIVETFIQNGFLEIATPSLDNIALFSSKEGGDNEKIMFKVLKRGEKLDIDSAKSESDLVDLGLRFDLTLPLSRYYANNLNDLPSPLKCFQIGNVWRGERPQRGRLRQLVQCDVDILGDSSITSEISLITTVVDALKNLGISSTTVCINDRRLINVLLEKNGFKSSSTDVMIILDKLDKISFESACKEIQSKSLDVDNFKNLYNDIEGLRETNIDDLTSIFDLDVVEDFITIIKTLKTLGYSVEYDPTLIRGMGYYTGTVFEIKDNSLGLSIAGGGRYDNLIGKLTGIDVPACGFSIGFERICLILEESNNYQHAKNKCAILVDKDNTDVIVDVIKYANKIKEHFEVVSLVTRKKNVKKQIKDLELLGYTKFVNSSEVLK